MADDAIASVAPSMNVLDLDPEHLLLGFETLSAREQATAKATCKLFYILIDEIGRTTSFLTSAVGQLSGVVGELSPRLEAKPSMGILFSKDDVAAGDLKKLARKLPYHIEMVGGHMSVVAGTDAAGNLVQSNSVCPHARSPAHEVALTLGRFPEATVRSFSVDMRKGSWRTQLEQQGVLTPGWKVFLLVSLLRETAEIVSLVQATHPDAAIIGGFATGDAVYRVKERNVESISEGLVGLMFSGNVPLAAFVSRGARSVADTPTFTFGADDLEVIDTGSDGCACAAPPTASPSIPG